VKTVLIILTLFKIQIQPEPGLSLRLDNLGNVIHIGPLLVDKLLQPLASLALPGTKMIMNTYIELRKDPKDP